MIGFVVVVVALLILDPLLDHLQIRKNKYIQYAVENRVATIAYLLDAQYALIAGNDWRQVLGVLVLIPAVRWIAHDYLLNLYRGLPLSYLGERSKTDRFLRKLPKGVLPITFKVLVLLISLWISFLIQLV